MTEALNKFKSILLSFLRYWSQNSCFLLEDIHYWSMLTNFEKFYWKICLWKKFKILSYPKTRKNSKIKKITSEILFKNNYFVIWSSPHIAFFVSSEFHGSKLILSLIVSLLPQVSDWWISWISTQKISCRTLLLLLWTVAVCWRLPICICF